MLARERRMYPRLLQDYKSRKTPRQIMDTGLDREELLRLSNEYDNAYPWWTQKEKALGEQIKREKEVGREILKEIIEWKFATLPGRIKRTLNLISRHNDAFVRSITRRALALPVNQCNRRIKELRRIMGIGISLASVILTFYDPENYCIYDIHVIRERYGHEPKYMFASNKHYLRLLNDLRTQRKNLKLTVRTIEKALFKKNIGSRTPSRGEL